MTCIYDGQKELMKAKGFKTVEELKAWQKETFEMTHVQSNVKMQTL